MPQTYHDFNPWARAANNIASGMIAVSEAKAKRAMWQQEMAQRQPVLEAQARNYNASAAKNEYSVDRDKTISSAVDLFMQTVKDDTSVDNEGRPVFGPEAQKAMVAIATLKSQNGSQVGTGFSGVVRGLSHNPNADLSLRSRERINDADNTADMEQEQAKITARANAPFNLSPGAARFDAEGNEIVRNPSAASSRGGGVMSPGRKAKLDLAKNAADDARKRLEELESDTSLSKKEQAQLEALRVKFKSAMDELDKFDAPENSSPSRGYGPRADGTQKGSGFLGEQKLPDGRVATEYSVGVNLDGRDIEIPTLVPTLTPQEKQMMVSDIIPNRKPVPKQILDKAVAFARQRMASGQSPFAENSSLTPEASSGDGVKTPAVGEVRKGYRFKGGDPSKPESWEKVN
jgi:hypothetical protein